MHCNARKTSEVHSFLTTTTRCSHKFGLAAFAAGWLPQLQAVNLLRAGDSRYYSPSLPRNASNMPLPPLPADSNPARTCSCSASQALLPRARHAGIDQVHRLRPLKTKRAVTREPGIPGRPVRIRLTAPTDITPSPQNLTRSEGN